MLIEKPFKIALIDDEPDQLDLYNRALKKVSDIKPLSFTDPNEALREIESQKIRGVITDINMPGCYGDDVLRACNRFTLGVQVYIVTGADSMLLADRCLNLGARSVIMKPVDLKKIREVGEQLKTHFETWNRVIQEVAARRVG